MKAGAAHSHGWLVGLAVGVTLMVGFSIRDEGTFNGMWFAVLERPR